MLQHELRTRILTSMAGVPILLAIFWVGGQFLAFLVLLICLLAFRELNNLFQAKGVGHSWWLVLPYVLLLPLCIGFVPELLHVPAACGRGVSLSELLAGNPPPLDYLHAWGALTFVWILALLMRELFAPREEVLASIGASFVVGMFSTLPFVSLIALDQVLSAGVERRALMITFLVCTWATDTFAYFGGRWLGRHKLFERASPKKTVEGFLFGLAGALLTGVASCLFFDPSLMYSGLVIGAVLGLLGPSGDLLESRFKRDAGVKDSARVLPGHGGVLDRFDSWIFAAPTLYLLARLGWLPLGG